MREDNLADECALLLPFYVNGTLDAEACAQLEQVLESSADLRAELEDVQAIACLVQSGGRVLADGGG